MKMRKNRQPHYVGILKGINKAVTCTYPPLNRSDMYSHQFGPFETKGRAENPKDVWNSKWENKKK